MIGARQVPSILAVKIVAIIIFPREDDRLFRLLYISGHELVSFRRKCRFFNSTRIVPSSNNHRVLYLSKLFLVNKNYKEHELLKLLIILNDIYFTRYEPQASSGNVSLKYLITISVTPFYAGYKGQYNYVYLGKYCYTFFRTVRLTLYTVYGFSYTLEIHKTNNGFDNNNCALWRVPKIINCPRVFIIKIIEWSRYADFTYLWYKLCEWWTFINNTWFLKISCCIELSIGNI